ncbi:hypothetical protein JX266_014484, partial [Neoarthrinium moseri]
AREQELAGAGGGGAIQIETKQKEPPLDRPLYLGFQPDQLVFSSDVPRPERKKMTSIVDKLNQMTVAMAGFWFVYRQCVWLELGDNLTNLQRVCMCIAIFSIAARLAQSAVRRRRTTRGRDRAAAKTGPLTRK